jgi:hypothetical protein
MQMEGVLRGAAHDSSFWGCEHAPEIADPREVHRSPTAPLAACAMIAIGLNP